MADYPPEEKVAMLLFLVEYRGNYRRAATPYRKRYPKRWHSNHSTIRNIYLRAQQGHLVRHRYENWDENGMRMVYSMYSFGYGSFESSDQ